VHGCVSFHTCSPTATARRKVNGNPGIELEANTGYVLHEAEVEHNRSSKFAVDKGSLDLLCTV